jgi:hypothetical protein
LEFQFILRAYLWRGSIPEVQSSHISGIRQKQLVNPDYKIRWSAEIDGTGEKFPLLLNKDGKPVDPKKMVSVRNDECIDVVCYFVGDQSL